MPKFATSKRHDGSKYVHPINRKGPKRYKSLESKPIDPLQRWYPSPRFRPPPKQLMGMRIRRVISTAKETKIDRITDNLSFVEHRADVPINKVVAGEETYAHIHVGTQFESRHKGEPIQAIYSPKYDNYMIINGHHRWAEAKAARKKTIDTWFSITNEYKGIGTLTLQDYQQRGLPIRIEEAAA